MTEELRELLREMDIVVCSRYIGDVVSCGLLWVVASQKERVVIFVGVGVVGCVRCLVGEVMEWTLVIEEWECAQLACWRLRRKHGHW